MFNVKKNLQIKVGRQYIFIVAEAERWKLKQNFPTYN